MLDRTSVLHPCHPSLTIAVSCYPTFLYEMVDYLLINQICGTEDGQENFYIAKKQYVITCFMINLPSVYYKID